jgi:hypothetical protein
MSKTLLAFFTLIAFTSMPFARAADSATVAGKWHFVLDTEGGDREFDSIFEQSAEKVTGKWAISDERKDGDAVAGTFADKQLTLEFPIQSEVGPGTIKLKGTLADDGGLTGNWVFGDYSGTFKAVRVVEGAPAK